jgi:Cu-Zn family superoxide dismutase
MERGTGTSADPRKMQLMRITLNCNRFYVMDKSMRRLEIPISAERSSRVGGYLKIHDNTEKTMRLNGWTAIGLVLGLAACGSAQSSSGPEGDAAPTDVAATAASEAPTITAVANLQTAQGKPAGTATAIPGQGTILLSLRVEDLPPGEHGVHVHMVGKCDGPKLESAGGHWNPGNKHHGMENPQGQHAGDMPDLTVGADGRGSVTYRLKGADIDGLLDSDGSAMVIHAGADDQKTDPSGNSGDRIACGVFAAS